MGVRGRADIAGAGEDGGDGRLVGGGGGGAAVYAGVGERAV